MTDNASPIVFDTPLRRKRLARHGGNAADVGFLARRAWADIEERLDDVDRRFERGFLHLPATLPDARFREQKVTSTVVAVDGEQPRGSHLAFDPEAVPFAPSSFDLAVSCLTLHWANDLPGALIQMKRALKPDGLLLACLLGGRTLTELRSCLFDAEMELTNRGIMRVSPFADALDMSNLLQRAGLALPVSDVDHITVRYDTPLHLMKDIRQMGEAHAPADPNPPLRRDVLQRALQLYAERHTDADGRIRASFDILWISGWAPAPTQPKPLRPGSAKARLADALGAEERSAGEQSAPLPKR